MNAYVNNTRILNNKRQKNQNDIVDYYDIVKKRKEITINRKRKLDSTHLTLNDNSKITANNVKYIEYINYEYDPIKLIYL